MPSLLHHLLSFQTCCSVLELHLPRNYVAIMQKCYLAVLFYCVRTVQKQKMTSIRVLG